MQTQHSFTLARVEKILRSPPRCEFQFDVGAFLNVLFIVAVFAIRDAKVREMLYAGLHRIQQADIFGLDPAS